jgi:hypothetical protein
MDNKIVNEINANNIAALKMHKNRDVPYYATISTATSVLTDYNQFPYYRWFRGQYKSSEPIVAEREAGWCMRDDDCRDGGKTGDKCDYPHHCFEAPCSTVYPCMTSFSTKYTNVDKENGILNKECIIKYR